MNIIAKIVATLKYIEGVNWCVSKGTLAITLEQNGSPMIRGKMILRLAK